MFRGIAAITLFAMASVAARAQTPSGTEELRQTFQNPPDDCRILMRWWWFGPSVTKAELEREMRVMKSAGIGGVEIQPVYPLELDDPHKQFRNFPYLSSEFLADLRFTAEMAKQLGMRVDITLGSGWPYGGPDTPITEAAGRLRCDRVLVPAGTRSLGIPAMENGESLIAAFLANGDPQSFSPSGIEQLTSIHEGRVAVPSGGGGSRVILFFISSRTGQQVKRASIGAEGFVLDHYSRQAIEHHLSAVGDRLMEAFGANPPYAVFSDSLEVYGSDWTADFLDEFRKRRGYDLTPLLPALVAELGEQTRAVRHDWGKTLTELAEERYLTPIDEWARAHHTRFRSQAYGEPPVILSSNALVDLPEGEHGPEWRSFSAARWASSASHLYGRPVTSTETWTWLHSPAFRATPLDMKAEADLHFIEGINQLVGHGWPYSPESAGEPGWRFYAAAAFNEHNPWFQVMPQISRYLRRISFLLRQGQPANDIAIYLPTDDAWAGFKPGAISVDESMPNLLGPLLIPEVLNAGYNFDFVDDKSLEVAGDRYRILILPGVERIRLATLEHLRAYVEKGGLLVATRRLPSLAPGVAEARSDDAKTKELVQQIFKSGRKSAQFVPDERMLGSTLKSLVKPDFASGAAAAPVVGFVHRKLASADFYFVVNTSNQLVDTEAEVRTRRSAAEWWDPFTGEASLAECRSSGETTVVPLHLAPYESRVIVFSEHTMQRTEAGAAAAATSLDISSDWHVTFSGLRRTIDMTKLKSWTEDEQTQFYSGRAVYEKRVVLPAIKPGMRMLLDFGPGEAVPPPVDTQGLGMRALLESPVRESAVVYVNGKEAGAVWHPPYELDVTQFLRAGENQLRIEVANLAINGMAGRALPDYRLLNLRYGQRFTPQGFENLKPLPAGILGPVRLITW